MYPSTNTHTNFFQNGRQRQSSAPTETGWEGGKKAPNGAWKPVKNSPFPNRLLSGLYSLAQRLLFPSYWAADRLLSLIECCSCCSQHRCYHCCSPWGLLAGPWLLLLLLLSMPVALLGLLLWLPLQAARRPFAYKHTKLSRPPELWELPGKGRAFSFVSANVCLLPDGLATFSNLGQMWRRVACIGQRLTQGEFLPPTKYGATMSSPPEGGAVPGGISVPFPPAVDFVCLQEVFDQRAAARLCQLLSPVYEHIVYDVGSYGLQGCSALKLFNSGLLVASRYPVLAAQYRCYLNGTGEDALSAKGLLSVQVRGCPRGGEPRATLGLPPCSHVHHSAEDAQTRYGQLTKGLSWVKLFQDAQTQPGDVVAFDVFCGDFNFDNCSLEQNHNIFHQYQDPCRVGPRQDKPWAIGTCLNMKRTLEQEEGRRTYLACPILQDGRPDPSAAGSPWEGRRIDYILYREHRAPISLTTVSAQLQGAGLTESLFMGRGIRRATQHGPGLPGRVRAWGPGRLGSLLALTLTCCEMLAGTSAPLWAVSCAALG
uniref:sphingomyelin phosphodiesterase n=1 Tax=Chelydra serpentina TaxID=8475 RepID=A0A8C3THG3_CHESE